MKGIKNLVFDTCGTGYFEGGKEVPEIADLNDALAKKRMKAFKVTTLTEVDMPRAEVVYELQIAGLG